MECTTEMMRGEVRIREAKRRSVMQGQWHSTQHTWNFKHCSECVSLLYAIGACRTLASSRAYHTHLQSVL